MSNAPEQKELQQNLGYNIQYKGEYHKNGFPVNIAKIVDCSDSHEFSQRADILRNMVDLWNGHNDTVVALTAERDALKLENDALTSGLEAVTNDLECEIKANYPEYMLAYPHNKQSYDNDMEIVLDAKELLSQIIDTPPKDTP